MKRDNKIFGLILFGSLFISNAILQGIFQLDMFHTIVGTIGVVLLICGINEFLVKED